MLAISKRGEALHLKASPSFYNTSPPPPPFPSHQNSKSKIEPCFLTNLNETKRCDMTSDELEISSLDIAGIVMSELTTPPRASSHSFNSIWTCDIRKGLCLMGDDD